MTVRLDVSRVSGRSVAGAAGRPRHEIRQLHVASKGLRVRVRSVQTATERWRSHCLGCMRVWEDVYVVRYCGDAVAWRLGGVAVQPPWVDRSCSACGSLRVKVLSAGLVVRGGAAE